MQPGSRQCGPCRAVPPILDELAGEYAKKITIGKLKADENLESITAAGVVSIPTMNVYVGGKIVKSIHWRKAEAGAT